MFHKVMIRLMHYTFTAKCGSKFILKIGQWYSCNYAKTWRLTF